MLKSLKSQNKGVSQLRSVSHTNWLIAALGMDSKPMAGWSMLSHESALDFPNETPKKLRLDRSLVDFESGSREYGVSVEPEEVSELSEEGETDKLRCLFDYFLGVFVEEVFGADTFRPLPPMLGDGQCADLFKLFLAVRKKGGYSVVSKKGLWCVVAEESGMDLSFAATLKLVYMKYLDTLGRWLERYIVNNPNSSLNCTNPDLGGNLMDLKAEFKVFLSEFQDLKTNPSDFPHLGLSCDLGLKNAGDMKITALDSDVKVLNFASGKNNLGTGKLSDDDEKGSVVDTDRVITCMVDEGCSSDLIKRVDNVIYIDDDVESETLDSDGRKGFIHHDDDVMILDPAAVEELNISLKRKRECLSGLLNWVILAAKNPCDPSVGSLPDKSKWKSYGNAETWKQVLLAREAIFLKSKVDSDAEQYNWQKNQKMHPSMYEDQHSSAYNLRERLKCGKKLLNGKISSEGRACSESPSSVVSDLEDRTAGLEGHIDKGTTDSSLFSFLDRYPQNRIPLGPNFQAEVPEWMGETLKSDSKWIGVQVWPLEKPEKIYLIERDPIGKGRLGSCGCQVPGSMKCIRFHIAEKRLRVKRELSRTFYQWRFDKMGEEVGLSWTGEDEKKFMTIVSSNPPSLEKCFWDQIFKTFRTKSRADLVSYYYNVFILRRRGYQNRCCPNDIDSDDDDVESGIVTNDFEIEAHKSKNATTSLDQVK